MIWADPLMDGKAIRTFYVLELKIFSSMAHSSQKPISKVDEQQVLPDLRVKVICQPILFGVLLLHKGRSVMDVDRREMRPMK